MQVKRFLATVMTGDIKIRTIAAAETESDARLMALKNARSMYTPTERKSMKPFTINEIKEIEL